MVGDITVGKILLCVILVGSAGNILIWVFKVLHRKCYSYSLVSVNSRHQLPWLGRGREAPKKGGISLD